MWMLIQTQPQLQVNKMPTIAIGPHERSQA